MEFGFNFFIFYWLYFRVAISPQSFKSTTNTSLVVMMMNLVIDCVHLCPLGFEFKKPQKFTVLK